MEIRKPTIENHGLYAMHDMPCAVFHGEYAVIDCGTNIFYPSWKAQGMGWRLVQARTWWQRLALRIAFSGAEKL